MRTLLSILTILLLSLSAIAQDSLNVRRVGVFQCSANGVKVSGNYAYITDWNLGLHIVDVSNPTTPIGVGFYPCSAYEVFITGTRAFVAIQSGLLVIDVSNPATPQLLGSFIQQNVFWDVYVDGNYAYVTSGTTGIRILNISNPSNIQEVGSFDTPNFAEGIFVRDSFAYVADAGLGMRILNISNPSNIQEIGFFDTPGQAKDVFVLGSYAYVADGYSGLRVINIDNPSNPYETTYYSNYLTTDVTVTGRYAIISCSDAGIRILNISNPTSIFEIGYYNTLGDALSTAINNTSAFVADYGAGLNILDCSLALQQLTVVSSNESAIIPIGESQTIRWSGYVTGNVNIELNRTYPSPNWEMLFANTPNDGEQSWTVTGPYTNSARIRITSVENPAIGDTSDANFTIGIVPATPGNLTVTLQGEDALLAWARVDSSMSGYPITVERYLIFYRDDGSEPWQYLWATFGANATNFTHTSVVRYSPAMYYEVRAWIGDTDSFDRILRDISPGLREEDFLQRIGGNVSAPIVRSVK